MRKPMKKSIRALGAAALLVFTVGCGARGPEAEEPQAESETTLATGGRLLSDGYAFYPRVIRLEHAGAENGTILISVVGNYLGNWIGAIHRSVDNGQTFTSLSAVVDPTNKTGMCCHTLYELPSPVGALP